MKSDSKQWASFMEYKMYVQCHHGAFLSLSFAGEAYLIDCDWLKICSETPVEQISEICSRNLPTKYFRSGPPFGFSVVEPEIPNYVKTGANDVIWYKMRNLVF
jgi:hypothetical protein